MRLSGRGGYLVPVSVPRDVFCVARDWLWEGAPERGDQGRSASLGGDLARFEAAFCFDGDCDNLEPLTGDWTRPFPFPTPVFIAGVMPKGWLKWGHRSAALETDRNGIPGMDCNLLEDLKRVRKKGEERQRPCVVS